MGRTRSDAHYNVGYDDGYGEVLDDFPKADARDVHPWDVWCDGQTRVLRRGKHFKAETAAGMRSTVYAYAKRHNLAVTVRLGRPCTLASGKTVYEQPDRFLTLRFPD